MDACGGHGGVFVFGGALAAADDGAGVAHAAAGRRGLAGYEADYRLFYVGFDPLRSGFFRVSADFADQDDRVCVGVVIKKAHRV